jgi:secretion/DNA translocation related TadE-like protein
MRRERDAGSASVLAVGVVGAVTTLALAAVSVSSLLVDRAVAAGAADSAALAAADAAAGYVAGPPCDAAREIAGELDGVLAVCRVTGTTVDVEVRSARTTLGVPVGARARAGQPSDALAGPPAGGSPSRGRAAAVGGHPPSAPSRNRRTRTAPNAPAMSTSANTASTSPMPAS